MTAIPDTPELEKKETVTIDVDGREIEAEPGELVIAAAERNGVYIPRFCYHPRMKPVGMCRMCLVNVEGPRGTSMQVSCMLTATEGMKVDTQAPEVKKAQDGVLEFLLINHPLDCPVCDKGGECPLQDQTLTFGPGETRFVEEKRHFEKPINISSLVALDRERCILCDRCTRFSKEVAGDPLIHFQSRGNQTEVNVFPDDPFSSYFSGNTVQICPVGALTATPYRFKARPWDLDQVESTCTSCSFGCRVAVQSTADKLTRYLGLDAEPTNHGWMCDKGRFDYESINSDERLTAPRLTRDGATNEVSWGEALVAVATAIKSTSSDRVAFVGGSRLSNEDQYAWAKFAKAVVGTDNVDAQLGDGIPAEVVLGVKRATIDEACKAKAVVLFAPDLKEELPVLHLRLREAVVDHGLQVIEVASHETSFTKHAKHHIPYRTGDAPAVANALIGRTSGDAAGVDASVLDSARETLMSAGDVVVIFGRQSLAESSQSIAEAVGIFANYTNAKFLPTLRRSNVLGALDMGLAPGVLPGRVTLEDGKRWFTEAWGATPKKTGLDATGSLKAASLGNIDVLVLLGADPLSDFPDAELARLALDNTPMVVAVDIFNNRSVAKAHVVLPAAAYAERSGTTTNIEGRVTRLGQKTTPPGVAWSDWMIANGLAAEIGSELGFETAEGIWAEIEAVAPSHAGMTNAVLAHRDNRDGVVVGSSLAGDIAPRKTDPQVVRPSGVVPPPISYRLAEASTPTPVDGYAVRLVSGRKLYDLGTHVQLSPHLAGLKSQDSFVRVHPSTLAPLGVQSGGEVRLRNAKGTFVVKAIGDETVARGIGVMAFNLTESDGPSDLIDATQPVTNVRVETP